MGRVTMPGMGGKVIYIRSKMGTYSSLLGFCWTLSVCPARFYMTKPTWTLVEGFLLMVCKIITIVKVNRIKDRKI